MKPAVSSTVSVDSRAFDRAAAALSAAGFEDAATPIVRNALRRSADTVRLNVRKALRRHRRTGRLERGVHTTWKGAGLAFQLRVSSTGPTAHLIAGGVRPHHVQAHDPHHPMPFGGGKFAVSAFTPGFRGDPYFRRGIDTSLPAIRSIVDAAAAAMAAELARRMEVR